MLCKVVIYIYIANLPKIMSRYATPPIVMNDILRRYLKDICYFQKVRIEKPKLNPNKILEIDTLIVNELYPDNFDEVFISFKEYMTSQNILKFLTIDELTKETGKIYEDEDIMRSIEIDRHKNIEFEKFFPVEVIDYNKLEEFTRKYGRVPKVKVEKKKEKEKTDYDPVTKKLTKGNNSHNFMKGKSTTTKRKRVAVFEKLWENHCLESGGNIIRGGKYESFDNFMIQTNTLSREGLNNEVKVKSKTRWVLDIIFKIRTDDNIPVWVECGKIKGVLLTVRD